MTPPDETLRLLYEHYQERSWDAAARLLHPEARLHMPATDERLVGRAQVIGLQRDYPEPWGELRVLRVVAAADTAVAEIEIDAAECSYRCAAFWTLRDGQLHEGTEYWVTVGAEQVDPGRRPGHATSI